MTLVSVVIPTYNRADVLPNAIDSVLAQTHDELELIVVDDASADGTPDVVNSYDDPRILYTRHQTNRGGSAARNTGISAATGEYVAFLDSDDEWLPSKLERQVSLLESRSEEWVGVYCDVTAPDPGGTPRLPSALESRLGSDPPRHREGGTELIGELLTDRLHTSAGSTLLVELHVAGAVGGFDTAFERFQDTEFLVRVLEWGKLAHLPEAHVVRDPAGHPSPETAERALERIRETFEDHVERLEASGEDVVGAQHLILAKEYLAAGDIDRGLRYARTATPTSTQYPGLVAAAARGLGQRLRS